MRAFGPPVVVALNRFPADADSEIEALRRLCAEIAVPLPPSTAWAQARIGTARRARASSTIWLPEVSLIARETRPARAAVNPDRRQRGVTNSLTPPSGRTVIAIVGTGGGPSPGANRNRASRVARMICACIIAKFAPTQTRGPAPNGR